MIIYISILGGALYEMFNFNDNSDANVMGWVEKQFLMIIRMPIFKIIFESFFNDNLVPI